MRSWSVQCLRRVWAMVLVALFFWFVHAKSPPPFNVLMFTIFYHGVSGLSMDFAHRSCSYLPYFGWLVSVQRCYLNPWPHDSRGIFSSQPCSRRVTSLELFTK